MIFNGVQVRLVDYGVSCTLAHEEERRRSRVRKLVTMVMMMIRMTKMMMMMVDMMMRMMMMRRMSMRMRMTRMMMRMRMGMRMTMMMLRLGPPTGWWWWWWWWWWGWLCSGWDPLLDDYDDDYDDGDVQVGTPYWMAPEVILSGEIDNQEYDARADVWLVHCFTMSFCWYWYGQYMVNTKTTSYPHPPK